MIDRHYRNRCSEIVFSRTICSKLDAPLLLSRRHCQIDFISFDRNFVAKNGRQRKRRSGWRWWQHSLEHYLVLDSLLYRILVSRILRRIPHPLPAFLRLHPRMFGKENEQFISDNIYNNTFIFTEHSRGFVEGIPFPKTVRREHDCRQSWILKDFI